MRLPLKSVLAVWLPPVLWLGFIFLASTDVFSSRHTESWLHALLSWLMPDAPARTIYVANVLIRKAAHVAAYGVLSVLLFRALRASSAPPRAAWRLRWAVLAVALCLGAAALDEWHQSGVPSRSGSLRDVLLDTTGATLAQIGLYGLWRRRRRTLGPRTAASGT